MTEGTNLSNLFLRLFISLLMFFPTIPSTITISKSSCSRVRLDSLGLCHEWNSKVLLTHSVRFFRPSSLNASPSTYTFPCLRSLLNRVRPLALFKPFTLLDLSPHLPTLSLSTWTSTDTLPRASWVARHDVSNLK